ncbi:RNA ligase-domain-containing protein [Mycena galopus ATCC 62051]|nr:RNA ligase-domain-containing protein [Mycena galopus ATCC 62051]
MPGPPHVGADHLLQGLVVFSSALPTTADRILTRNMNTFNRSFPTIDALLRVSRLHLLSKLVSGMNTAACPVVPSDSALIASLHAISAAKPKLIKRSEYAAPADPEIKVRSWKMDDFKYYDVPSPFTTLARGIFTVELPSSAPAEGKGEGEGGKQEYRIVARGATANAQWDTLAAHTTPPYTLSLKSNGCIIFIAALTPTKLLVTSKHSIGPIPGQSVSHAEAGEVWLRKYFEAKGKIEADLAWRLWAENWMAIAFVADERVRLGLASRAERDEPRWMELPTMKRRHTRFRSELAEADAGLGRGASLVSFLFWGVFDSLSGWFSLVLAMTWVDVFPRRCTTGSPLFLYITPAIVCVSGSRSSHRAGSFLVPNPFRHFHLHRGGAGTPGREDAEDEDGTAPSFRWGLFPLRLRVESIWEYAGPTEDACGHGLHMLKYTRSVW